MLSLPVRRPVCRALIRTPAPPSVACLSRLQRACFCGWSEDALPPGPWAASLQLLGASYGALIRSGQLLDASGKLEQLHVLGGKRGAGGQPVDSERFWRWCTSHAPLRQLHVELQRGAEVCSSIPVGMNALRDARPALRVHCRADRWYDSDSPFVRAFRHSIFDA